MNRTSTALPLRLLPGNVRKVTLLALLVLLAGCAMVVAVNFGSQQLMLTHENRTPQAGSHAHHLCHRRRLHRVPIHHQQYHRHPCLLGMNPHTPDSHGGGLFAGSQPFIPQRNLSFAADVILMGIDQATIIYSYLFKKTNHNVLYVLLIGTVLSSFFLQHPDHADPGDGPMSTTACSPPWWRTLKTSTPRSSSSPWCCWRADLVLRRIWPCWMCSPLGKHQAINLGVDYDRSNPPPAAGRHPASRWPPPWWAPSPSSA